MKNSWYQKLFSNYAQTYDRQPFTTGTVVEVDFIEKEINYNRSIQILDIGCGTGRHAIELAKRGYRVVGIDLSESQLDRARQKALQAGVTVEFRQQDARCLTFTEEFDLVIMLCEGAFSLMETDEMNYQILKSATRALKSPGIFIFNALNALFPLKHSVRDFINQGSVEAASSDHHFDLLTLRDYSTLRVKDDSGAEKILHCNERYFVPSEISWYLKTLHFTKIEFFGCDTGAFSREVPLTDEHYEMLVIAER